MTVNGTWERVRKQSTRRGDPQLTIYSNGDAHINVRADEAFFEDVEAVQIYRDEDNYRLAFGSAEQGKADAYSLTRSDGERGADLRLKTALEQLGIDIDAIDETHFFDLVKEDGMPVADVSSLAVVSDLVDDGDEGSVGGDETDEATDDDVEAAVDEAAVAEKNAQEADQEGAVRTNGHEPDNADKSSLEGPVDDQDQDVEADDPLLDQLVGILSRLDSDDEFTAGGLANELDADGRTVGAKLRAIRNDDEALNVTKVGEDEDTGTAVYAVRPDRRDRDGGSDGDGDSTDEDGGDLPSRDEVRHVSGSVVRDAADEVVSVQELSHALDVSEGQARKLARKYDVYGDLRDNVYRPGVDR